MRVISTLVILLGIGLFLSPKALAAETRSTDETNTNFKIQDNIEIVNGIAYDKSNVLAYAPYNYEGYKPVSESKREAVIAKWKKKQVSLWNNLPKEKFTINASAYTASADECGNSKGITASGLKVMEKRTLACPPQYPFGTKINIEGRGTYVCEDRGGAIKGNHFDIYVETKKEAFAFGRRNLLAEVVID
jgi:3D (Asp-Asp-Asp) domain-containing protein